MAAPWAQRAQLCHISTAPNPRCLLIGNRKLRWDVILPPTLIDPCTTLPSSLPSTSSSAGPPALLDPTFAWSLPHRARPSIPVAGTSLLVLSTAGSRRGPNWPSIVAVAEVAAPSTHAAGPVGNPKKPIRGCRAWKYRRRARSHAVCRRRRLLLPLHRASIRRALPFSHASPMRPSHPVVVVVVSSSRGAGAVT